MIKHIKLWWDWAKLCKNNWIYKILVLYGFANSPTFEIYKHMNGTSTMDRLTKNSGGEKIFKDESERECVILWKV